MDNGLKNADDLLRGIFSHMGNVGQQYKNLKPCPGMSLQRYTMEAIQGDMVEETFEARPIGWVQIAAVRRQFGTGLSIMASAP